jgi:hypothetical protein
MWKGSHTKASWTRAAGHGSRRTPSCSRRLGPHAPSGPRRKEPRSNWRLQSGPNRLPRSAPGHQERSPRRPDPRAAAALARDPRRAAAQGGHVGEASPGGGGVRQRFVGKERRPLGVEREAEARGDLDDEPAAEANRGALAVAGAEEVLGEVGGAVLPAGGLGDRGEELRRRSEGQRRGRGLAADRLRRPKARERSSSGRSVVRSSPPATSVMEVRSGGGVAARASGWARACGGSAEEGAGEWRWSGGDGATSIKCFVAMLERTVVAT